MTKSILALLSALPSCFARSIDFRRAHRTILRKITIQIKCVSSIEGDEASIELNKVNPPRWSVFFSLAARSALFLRQSFDSLAARFNFVPF